MIMITIPRASIGASIGVGVRHIFSPGWSLVSQRNLRITALQATILVPWDWDKTSSSRKTSIHLGGYRLRPTLKYIDSHTPSSVVPPSPPPRQSARRNQDIRFEHAQNTSRELAGLSKRSAVVDDYGNDAGGGRETPRNTSD